MGVWFRGLTHTNKNGCSHATQRALTGGSDRGDLVCVSDDAVVA